MLSFSVGCVNSVVGACEILFQEEKFSLSILEMINWMDYRIAIKVSKVSM